MESFLLETVEKKFSVSFCCGPSITQSITPNLYSSEESFFLFCFLVFFILFYFFWFRLAPLPPRPGGSSCYVSYMYTNKSRTFVIGEGRRKKEARKFGHKGKIDRAWRSTLTYLVFSELAVWGNSEQLAIFLWNWSNPQKPLTNETWNKGIGREYHE